MVDLLFCLDFLCRRTKTDAAKSQPPTISPARYGLSLRPRHRGCGVAGPLLLDWRRTIGGWAGTFFFGARAVLSPPPSGRCTSASARCQNALAGAVCRFSAVVRPWRAIFKRVPSGETGPRPNHYGSGCDSLSGRWISFADLTLEACLELEACLASARCVGTTVCDSGPPGPSNGDRTGLVSSVVSWVSVVPVAVPVCVLMPVPVGPYRSAHRPGAAYLAELPAHRDTETPRRPCASTSLGRSMRRSSPAARDQNQDLPAPGTHPGPTGGANTQQLPKFQKRPILKYRLLFFSPFSQPALLRAGYTAILRSSPTQTDKLSICPGSRHRF